jgi:hypothetical protein
LSQRHREEGGRPQVRSADRPVGRQGRLTGVARDGDLPPESIVQSGLEESFGGCPCVQVGEQAGEQVVAVVGRCAGTGCRCRDQIPGQGHELRQASGVVQLR